METVVTKLTAEQRMDMIMKALNPRDPEDVERYLSGNGQLSLSEKQERAKKLFPNAAGTGSAQEKEIYIDKDKTYSFNNLSEVEKIASAVPSQKNIKNYINEDFKNSTSVGKVFNTDDLLSLKQKNAMINLETIELEGFENAKKYLNAFIANLQSPSFQNRRTLYKNLYACLKAEDKYKDNQNALKAYNRGEIKAETAMFQNLQ